MELRFGLSRLRFGIFGQLLEVVKSLINNENPHAVCRRITAKLSSIRTARTDRLRAIHGLRSRPWMIVILQQ
ncbi:hypothetical protein RGR602_PC01957 (plasmid) [Rhizobium gallicum bv. gallicum R602sp]|uniref:Uncharacterized protein n=1 Tax=Rhizobium gallicum bv. gallicum R602sp TaxID=1041138 RepID=A0A0B4XGY5_9HYPH|nr:hypothetical protein RGR602_PC01957 [Rhizobium gallicum bv. gallicum R602sp]